MDDMMATMTSTFPSNSESDIETTVLQLSDLVYDLTFEEESSNGVYAVHASIADILRISVHDIVQEQETSFNDILAFSRQLERSGVRVCTADAIRWPENEEHLGSGATFSVFKGYLKPEGRPVAVKRMRLENVVGDSGFELRNREYRSLLEALVLELRVMMHPWFLAHPNIVDLLGVYWDTDNKTNSTLLSHVKPVMIVELADENHPTLQHAIDDRELNLSEEQRFRLLEDVAEGMTIIHGAKMIHGDLKPENILLFFKGMNYVAKVADFGFSNPYLDSEQPIGGTEYWNAPECLNRAIPEHRRYAKTIARDLYSYGLVMWYTIFKEMPFGPYGYMDECAIADQKLSDGSGSITQRLKEKLKSYKSLPMISVTRDEILPDEVQNPIRWSRIRGAMLEMFKVDPQSRNVAFGEIHEILKPLLSTADILPLSQNVSRDQHYAQKLNNERKGQRTQTVSRLSKNDAQSMYLTVTILSPYVTLRPDHEQAAGYHNANIPYSIQQTIFKESLERLTNLSTDDVAYVELTLVLAAYYRTGFGVEINFAEASRLDIIAAKHGSRIGQYHVLTHLITSERDLDVDRDSITEWLLHSVTIDAFQNQYAESSEAGRKAVLLLKQVPPDDLLVALTRAFKQMELRSFWIYHLDYGIADKDDMFQAVVDGDLSSVRRLIRETPAMATKRYNGHTLLHIAAEFCHKELINMLVREFGLSVDETTSDGCTAIEIAVDTGSLDCLVAILALGASPQSALSQRLFTTIASQGCRGNRESEDACNPGRIREILRTLAMCSKLTLESGGRALYATKSTPETISQDLLDGNFRQELPSNTSDIEDFQVEEEQFFTPLQYALSITHHDSVLALLALGAGPDIFRNQNPPLHLAVLTQQPVLVALLLGYGADPNIRDAEAFDRETPLHVANNVQDVTFSIPERLEITNDWENVDFSKEQSSPTNSGDVQPPILRAGEQENEISDEADNDSDDEMTVLQTISYGASQSTKECVVAIIHILVKAGAEIHAKNSKGQTPLALALMHEDFSTVEALRSLGASE